ncbi:hypothetical protein BFP70_15420 [Thioclava sp. SK-1]|uniref:hypothetical protein n=1 Tax=Thioclava sp. SK-1 TaxID=1889770 RepID=UPI0008252CC7|nr:hypothetical protein [Thioclava sp. SK-1]OCX61461.1 hypothetical protein BFP70_15420 [Thioclava sp. SK-1]
MIDKVDGDALEHQGIFNIPSNIVGFLNYSIPVFLEILCEGVAIVMIRQLSYITVRYAISFSTFDNDETAAHFYQPFGAPDETIEMGQTGIFVAGCIGLPSQHFKNRIFCHPV